MIFWSIFDLPEKVNQLKKLEFESEDPDLWNDRNHAQKVMKKIVDLRDEIKGWEKFSEQINQAKEIAELSDESFRSELEFGNRFDFQRNGQS